MPRRDYKVRGDIIVEAFQAAWIHALEDELITSYNIARVPGELMRAVLVSVDEGYPNADVLGKIAFAKWRADYHDRLEELPSDAFGNSVN
jgi:hypothetical protein